MATANCLESISFPTPAAAARAHRRVRSVIYIAAADLKAADDAGWKFDAAKWAKSLERHKKWNMEKVFKQFDADGDGKVSFDEFVLAAEVIEKAEAADVPGLDSLGI